MELFGLPRDEHPFYTNLTLAGSSKVTISEGFLRIAHGPREGWYIIVNKNFELDVVCSLDLVILKIRQLLSRLPWIGECFKHDCVLDARSIYRLVFIHSTEEHPPMAAELPEDKARILREWVDSVQSCTKKLYRAIQTARQLRYDEKARDHEMFRLAMKGYSARYASEAQIIWEILRFYPSHLTKPELIPKTYPVTQGFESLSNMMIERSALLREFFVLFPQIIHCWETCPQIEREKLLRRMELEEGLQEDDGELFENRYFGIKEQNFRVLKHLFTVVEQEMEEFRKAYQKYLQLIQDAGMVSDRVPSLKYLIYEGQEFLKTAKKQRDIAKQILTFGENT
jgi:hypothetical protein